MCRFTHSKSRDCDCGSYCAIVLLENNYIKLSTNHTHTRAAICTPWLFNSFVCSASLIIIQILKICPHEIISNLFYNHSFGGNASMAVSRTYYLCIFFFTSNTRNHQEPYETIKETWALRLASSFGHYALVWEETFSNWRGQLDVCLFNCLLLFKSFIYFYGD